MSKKLTKISIADANGELQELEIPKVPIKQVPTYSSEVASGDGLYITQDKKEMYLNGNLMGVADESYPEIIRNGKRMPMPKVVYATDTYIGHPSMFPTSSPIEKVIFTDIPNYLLLTPKEVFIRKSDNSQQQNIPSRYANQWEGRLITPSMKQIVWRNFDKTPLTNLSGAFFNHQHLSSLNIEDLNTTKVSNFSGMFSGCSSLTSLDVSNFNTQNGTNFYSMFSGCSSLTSLDVSNFKVINANCYNMFGNCSSLTSLDLNNFISITDIACLLSGCSSLTSVDISNLDTISVNNCYAVFNECYALKTIKLGEKFFRFKNSYELDFYPCPWGTGGEESLKSLKDSLVVNSYDRKANSLPKLTLRLSNATKNLLSADEKAIITAKGYTIA